MGRVFDTDFFLKVAWCKIPAEEVQQIIKEYGGDYYTALNSFRDICTDAKEAVKEAIVGMNTFSAEKRHEAFKVLLEKNINWDLLQTIIVVTADNFTWDGRYSGNSRSWLQYRQWMMPKGLFNALFYVDGSHPVMMDYLITEVDYHMEHMSK